MCYQTLKLQGAVQTFFNAGPACWICKVSDLHNTPDVAVTVTVTVELSTCMSRLKKNLRNDVQALHIWKKKCKSAYCNAATLIRQWQMRQSQLINNQADVTLEKFVKLEVMDESNDECQKGILGCAMNPHTFRILF